MVEALISEQRASDEVELPKELVQDVESEPASFLSDPCVLRFMMGDEVLGMVVIHVDDILFGCLKRIGEFVVQALGTLSRRRTWENCHFLLGLRISARP